MPPLRALAALLAVALCALEARALAGGGGGLVLRAPDTRAAPPPARMPAGVEPAFLAHMTADDVARGVYGLAAETGAVALTAEQRAALLPLVEDGGALRARLGALRAERRAARDAWLAEGARLVDVLGAARARDLARRAP